MALNTSGPISLAGATAGQSIAVELGLGTTTQISLNDTSVRTLAGVASGAIIMPTNFYGKSNAFAFSFAGGTNLDLRTVALAAGWNGTTLVTATNTGNITSASTGSYALTISGSFPGGVSFINNGTVYGRGGNAGSGGGAQLAGPRYHGVPDVANAGIANPGGAGSGGVPSLLVSVAVSLTNNGVIGGGGGGGGGGAGATTVNIPPVRGALGAITAGGSGGGGGAGSGSSGAAGVANYLGNIYGTPVQQASNGNAGNAGTASVGGGGGAAVQLNSTVGSGTAYAGAGGSGGSYGSAGAAGAASSATGYVAPGYSSFGPQATYVSNTGGGSGSAGAAIVGNSNITYITVGTIYGAIT
jgi:hypothetical protein